MAMDSPERVSSRMQPKYETLEYCFISMSLHWMFNGFEFLILCLLQQIDLVLSTPDEHLVCSLQTSRKAY